MKIDCVDGFLKTVPAFLHIKDKVIVEIRKNLSKRHYRKGHVVFQRGDEVTTLFIVETGKIEVYKTDEEARRLTLWYITPGELFCVPTVLSGSAIAHAEVVEDAVLYCLEKGDLERLMQKYPELAIGFLKCLSSRIRGYSDFIEAIAFTNTPARVAEVLLRYRDVDENGRSVCLLSRDEIMSLAGTCRETVSRALGRLKRENIIETGRRKIIIRDPEGLKRRCINKAGKNKKGRGVAPLP